MTHPTSRRWIVLLAATALQLCLGTVYAWSYFQQPLKDGYGWSNTQVTWTFSLAICCLGLAAAWGGSRLGRLGPRKLAVTGSILFSAGYLLAAVAPPLEVAGAALRGLRRDRGESGWAWDTSPRWPPWRDGSPTKRGLATGTVIMGFGFGALLMSKVFAPLAGSHLCRKPGGDVRLAGLWVSWWSRSWWPRCCATRRPPSPSMRLPRQRRRKPPAPRPATRNPRSSPTWAVPASS